MSTTQTQNTNNTRGARRGGGRTSNNNNNRGRPAATSNASAPTPVQPQPVPAQIANSKIDNVEVGEGSDGTGAAICHICAEPIKYYALPPCNHRTCHVCSLRLRALYKKTDCTFCKDPQPQVHFTPSPTLLYSPTLPSTYKDAKLAITFDTQEIMDETLFLLRFNCPDTGDEGAGSACEYVGTGWADLKLHVRGVHGRVMCDLCIRSKKVFAHEHSLYTPHEITLHLPSLRPFRSNNNSKNNNSSATAANNGGKIPGGVHPMCGFCKECFFSDDELYAHMRERHEECFVCKRNDVRDVYFRDYDSLETHFTTAHHPCTTPPCPSRKFVVFNTALDLQAHIVDEHGGEMSSRGRRDARRVAGELFAGGFEEVGGGGRRGAVPNPHNNVNARERDRDREPPPHRQQQPPQPPPPQPPQGARRRGRDGFGGALTGDVTPGRVGTPPPNVAGVGGGGGEVDAEVVERHNAFLARLASLAPNPTTAVPAVKSAIRSYRAGESSARDLISTIFTVLDGSANASGVLEKTASVVNAFVDLLEEEEEEKRREVLGAWKGFEIEQRRNFPDLVPTLAGSGSRYAAIASGQRVLNIKKQTTARSSGQVWDRVAQAASNGSTSTSTNNTNRAGPSRFPPLQPPVVPASVGPIPVVAQQTYRTGQRSTPWSASGANASSRTPTPAQASSSSSTAMTPRSTPGGGGNNKTNGNGNPPKLSASLFPELPTSANARNRAVVSGNVSLRNILGNPAPPSAPAWQAGGSNGGGPVVDSGSSSNGNGNDAVPVTGGGKGKKGKGKQKQTLFTLGSFPT